MLKPRRRYLMDPDAVTTLCRDCHERCDAAFSAGRLVVEPMGSGTFRYQVVYARDKHAARAAGVVL